MDLIVAVDNNWAIGNKGRSARINTRGSQILPTDDNGKCRCTWKKDTGRIPEWPAACGKR